MNMTRMMVAVLIAGSGLALHVTHAQRGRRFGPARR